MADANGDEPLAKKVITVLGAHGQLQKVIADAIVVALDAGMPPDTIKKLLDKFSQILEEEG